MKLRLIWLGIAVLAITAVVGMANINRIYAIYWKAENATVRLRGCQSTDCELHGTLRVSPLTGEYYVTRADGSEVWFNTSHLDMVSYPVSPK